jgi:hypothetical protein
MPYAFDDKHTKLEKTPPEYHIPKLQIPGRERSRIRSSQVGGLLWPMLGLWPGVVDSVCWACASRALLPVQGGRMLMIGARTSSLLAWAGTESCMKKVVMSSNMKTTTVFNEMVMASISKIAGGS